MKKKQTIRKRRSVFLWDDLYYEYDRFLQPPLMEDIRLLAVEFGDSTKSISLPPFLEVIQEVTGDERYQSGYIAANTQTPQVKDVYI